MSSEGFAFLGLPTGDDGLTLHPVRPVPTTAAPDVAQVTLDEVRELRALVDGLVELVADLLGTRLPVASRARLAALLRERRK